MILAVDSSALVLLVNPAATPPEDPATKKPVAGARERVEHLIAGLSSADTLIIPAPVLAEALVRAEEGGPGLLEAIGGLARVRVRPFGERAAVETAMMTREALLAGDKRGGSDAPWQKVKVDRQVIAVARVEGATKIYADDHGLVAFARRLGMDAVSTWDLPLPEQVQDLFTAAGVPEQPSSPEAEDEAEQPIAAGADAELDEVDVDDILRELEQEQPPGSEGAPAPASAPAAGDAAEVRQHEAEQDPPQEE